MIQYISEFGLPKEYSKKKKHALMVGKFIAKDEWYTKDIAWDLNMDMQKVYLSLTDCIINVLNNTLNSGISADEVKNGYIVIASMIFSAADLNETPIARDVHNMPVDCMWNPDNLSFNITIRGFNWEEITFSNLKVDGIVFDKDENGNYTITEFNSYPIVDSTTI